MAKPKRNNRRNRNRRSARASVPRPPKRRFLVVCEGEVTEPTYIGGFKKQFRALVDVEVEGGQGVPLTLVNKAKKHKADAAAEAKKEKDDNLLYDEVWCAFDVDNHPHLDEAKDMARGNEIELAISNECVELWLLLHFRENPGAQDRKSLAKMLKKYIPGYDKHFEFRELASDYPAARDRARRMYEAATNEGDANRNPTTGFYLLTESIARDGGGCGGGTAAGSAIPTTPAV